MQHKLSIILAKPKARIPFLTIAVFIFLFGHAQNPGKIGSTKNYIGIQPSFLMEPYDTIDALEVNILPLVFEHRFDSTSGIQFRTIVNYRFLEGGSGISQTGMFVGFNKYTNLIWGTDWLDFRYAPFTTYAYNQLDKIHTVTLGIEPGFRMRTKSRFSLDVAVQPGINYYPDKFSRDFVETESGFKSHFGIMFHAGVNF